MSLLIGRTRNEEVMFQCPLLSCCFVAAFRQTLQIKMSFEAQVSMTQARRQDDWGKLISTIKTMSLHKKLFQWTSSLGTTIDLWDVLSELAFQKYINLVLNPTLTFKLIHILLYVASSRRYNDTRLLWQHMIQSEGFNDWFWVLTTDKGREIAKARLLAELLIMTQKTNNYLVQGEYS